MHEVNGINDDDSRFGVWMIAHRSYKRENRDIGNKKKTIISLGNKKIIMRRLLEVPKS